MVVELDGRPTRGRGESGSWSSDTLTVTVRIRCLGEPNLGPGELTFDDDPATDTITSVAEVSYASLTGTMGGGSAPAIAR